MILCKQKKFYKGGVNTNERELCTQYRLIAALLKRGDSQTVIDILEGAIKRIDPEALQNDKNQDKPTE